MKINEMTDRELMDYEGEQKEIMGRVNNRFTPHLDTTVEQRERALNVLSEIRAEKCRRGWEDSMPKAEYREKYERWTAKYTAGLAAAEKTGDVVKVFAMRNRLNDCRFALEYINGNN